MNEIGRRVEATIATQAKFKDKPFDWTKAATCIHLARYHAAKMGHKLPIVPRFRSVLGAKKALRDVGFDSLPDLLDSYFTRIPPAFMQVGDLLALEGEHGWHSLVVKGDRSKFLGWHEDAIGCTIMDIDLSVAEGAWRL